jgi:hypothetical protein
MISRAGSRDHARSRQSTVSLQTIGTERQPLDREWTAPLNLMCPLGVRASSASANPTHFVAPLANVLHSWESSRLLARRRVIPWWPIRSRIARRPGDRLASHAAIANPKVAGSNPAADWTPAPIVSSGTRWPVWAARAAQPVPAACRRRPGIGCLRGLLTIRGRWPRSISRAR